MASRGRLSIAYFKQKIQNALFKDKDDCIQQSVTSDLSFNNLPNPYNLPYPYGIYIYIIIINDICTIALLLFVSYYVISTISDC